MCQERPGLYEMGKIHTVIIDAGGNEGGLVNQTSESTLLT